VRRAGLVLLLILVVPACASDEIDAHFHEFGAPSGAYAGPKPRGYVLVLHPGAWAGDDAMCVRKMRREANLFPQCGYARLNTTYSGGRRSPDSVTREYDALRNRVGPSMPICAMGSSAGGHLALVLTHRRP
jgi:acetyl esterase/lipase